MSRPRYLRGRAWVQAVCAIILIPALALLEWGLRYYPQERDDEHIEDL